MSATETTINRKKPSWMTEPMEEVPFNPTEVDVIATKVRTWNKTHPGNVFYRHCIKDAVKAYNLSTATEVRNCAEKLYNLLVTERRGRFLKLPEGLTTHHTCKVLTQRRTMDKIIHALKTARSRVEVEKLRVNNVKTPKNGSNKVNDNIQSHEQAFLRELTNPQTPNSKKRKLVTPSTAGSWSKQKSGNSKPVKATSSTKRKPIYSKIPNDKPTYRAEQANPDWPIHDYALHCISKVCSQADPATAHRALDQPLDLSMEESKQQRLMRLQLRQRFVASQSIGLTPIEFARRLLSLWGGKLLQVPVAPKPKRVKVPAQQQQQSSALQLFPSSPAETSLKQTDGNDVDLAVAAPTLCSTTSLHTPSQEKGLAIDLKPSPISLPTLPEQQQSLPQLDAQRCAELVEVETAQYKMFKASGLSNETITAMCPQLKDLIEVVEPTTVRD